MRQHPRQLKGIAGRIAVDIIVEIDQHIPAILHVIPDSLGIRSQLFWGIAAIIAPVSPMTTDVDQV